jgi:acetoin utilization deacetylase AcuC-like enzyme
MQVIYSEIHHQHNPPFEVFEGGNKMPLLESPERMDSILAALRETGWADIGPPEEFGLEPILAVHTEDYLEFLQNGYAEWQAQSGQLGYEMDTSVLLGGTFPPRRLMRKPASIVGKVGYYTFDLSCPIVAGTYPAARAAANCALTGARLIQAGENAVFALCRPPGHHAGQDFSGGYCYLNNASIAAKYLTSPQSGGRASERVALLDVDYHCGNGSEDIFYDSAEVLTLSLHADPERQYPYFTGYADEIGMGSGQGFHRNFPLPIRTDDAAYLQILDEALSLVRKFGPRYLVLSFGADIFAGDPLGDLAVTTAGFTAIGERIAALNLPTLIVMEGGYNTGALGQNTCALLAAFENRSSRT